MIYIFLFILGAIIGSFLNVLGLRYGTGKGMGGRSQCPSCGKTLRWYELVPVLSFVYLKGKCSGCGNKISWQYVLVELWTGILFVSLYSLFGLTTHYALFLVVFCIYTVILIYDFHHKIIPDPLVFLTIFISFLYPLLLVKYSLVDWLAGPVLFTVFGLGWLISRGRALGFGDAKLVLSIGLLLGAAQGLSAVIMAFWIGTLVTIPLVLFRRKGLTIKSEVPFAPFLILGAWVALYFNLDLFHVLSFF